MRRQLGGNGRERMREREKERERNGMGNMLATFAY